MQSIALFSGDNNLRDMLNQLEDCHVNYFSLDLDPDNLPKGITLAIFDFDIVPLSLLDEWEQFPRLHLRKMAVVSAEHLSLVDAVLERLDNYMVRPLSLSLLQFRMQDFKARKSWMMGFISSMFYTHLNQVRGFTKLLNVMYDELDDKDKSEMLDWIEKGAKDIDRLFAQLFTAVKIEDREFFSFKMIDISEIIDLVRLKKHCFDEVSQELIVNSLDTETKVYAVRHGLVMILEELVENASRYSDEDSKIEIGFAVENETLVCSVADYGAGISHPENVFKKFFAGNWMDQHGIGLGLYISKQIIEMHGGEIWFESELGVGTTFYFTLPIAK